MIGKGRLARGEKVSVGLWEEPGQRKCASGGGGKGWCTVREWKWFPAVRYGLLSYYYPHTADDHSVLRWVLVLCSWVGILLPGQLKAFARGSRKDELGDSIWHG